MDKKKIIILSAVGVVAIILVITIIILVSHQPGRSVSLVNQITGKTETTFTPVFLTNDEKTKMDIPQDKKIEVINRDSTGEVTVYKIINRDSDIVDPAKISPLSPKN